MAPFAQNLSQHIAILRELFKHDTDFQWTPSHETAFKKIKRLICKEITLSYFDPRVETHVQVDASSHGLGAVLIQNGRAIAFASKSLSDCERRYANIEREMLAVVFVCERFHTYVYGKQFTIPSDHKPLEMIHLKNLAAAPQRLQRMLLRIQPYDIVIRYKPGKEMTLADSMSRQPCINAESLEFDVQISHVQFSTQKLDELRRETRNDNELLSLLKVIADGWPDRQRDLHPQLRAYWPFRDELVADDGIVLKGNQIVMPASLHAETLAKLHESHQGIEKTRLRARSCVFWRGINQDIEDVVRKCATCQQMQRAQQRQPLMPHETPSRAWQIVGTDLFVINRETYLLVSDYYSKFPFVYVIPSPVTSTAVIAKMKSPLFAEQGVPQRVISDNGGHFSSDAFRRFADQWCFDHVTSSPHYPQSNGFIERHVQTVKHTLKKVGPRSDVHMALLVLRATPIDSHLPSPAELLYEEWYQTYLSQHGMPVARDAKFVLASTSDRPLPKNAMTLVVSHTWQNFHVDNTSVHVTRSPTGGNLVALPRNAYNHVPTESNRPAEEYYRRTGATSARQLRSTYFSTPTLTRSATPVRLLLMVRDQSPSSHTRTARNLRRLSQ